MQLITDRLLIRSFSIEDLDAYAALVADPELMRYLGSEGFWFFDTYLGSRAG